MQFKRSESFVFSLIIMGIFLCISADLAFAAPELQNDLCIICHKTEPADIDSAGGKHKTSVACLDCHNGHPPVVENNIPKCADCHDGEPHYNLKNCLSCHANPHKPLNIILADNLTDPCLTCHTEQIDQLKKFPSKHTAQACTTCHSKTHGNIPNCMECHSPHSKDMQQSDCVSCHQVHMPLEVTYAETIPSKNCGACHDAVLAELTASKALHNQLLCAECHQAKHKMIPACQDCHGTPHPEGMMSKFPVCGDCHGSPHNLYK